MDIWASASLTINKLLSRNEFVYTCINVPQVTEEYNLALIKR